MSKEEKLKELSEWLDNIANAQARLALDIERTRQHLIAATEAAADAELEAFRAKGGKLS